jgi:predicted amidohydrolase
LVEQGNLPFEVFQTPIGNIGILICHDVTFPESARILTLRGADVIAIPTNWPRQLDIVAKYMINTRAAENFVHIIAADRVGVERKARFLGMSKIVNARGMTKTSAGIRSEEIIYADIDLAYARIKYYPWPVGRKIFDVVNDRRIEFYGDIVRPDVY